MRNSVLAVVVGMALCGCSTNGPLNLQPSPPSTISSYVVPALTSLRSSTVSVDLTDCPSYAMMTKRGISGVSRPVCSFPLRKVIESECDKVVKGNFRKAAAGDSPVADLKVSVERVLLRRDGVITSCDLELIISFTWQNKSLGTNVVRHYESRQFGAFADENHVPDCVYKAVQDAVGGFLRDLSRANARAAASDSLKW